jgi:hypothetical protein
VQPVGAGRARCAKRLKSLSENNFSAVFHIDRLLCAPNSLKINKTAPTRTGLADARADRVGPARYEPSKSLMEFVAAPAVSGHNEMHGRAPAQRLLNKFPAALKMDPAG